MKFCRYKSVTTHLEWAKLTRTKILWHIRVIDSFCGFKSNDWGLGTTYFSKYICSGKSSTSMTRVLIYKVFFKRKINEQEYE
jgi:hypothetical protein